MFEGEYLNGKIWNGKGYDHSDNTPYQIKEGNANIKEYNYDGRLLSECEYLNGKRNGKGKEYVEFGILEFEGEYKNDKKIKGKEYFSNGNLKYEGEYLNDKKWIN